MSNKLTVLMPTYRREKYLHRAMLSVLRQTYENLTISIFDNASDDNTKDIVNNLSQKDSRIKYHCHQENIGMLNNFNYAFNSIDTPYFSILTDDDLLVNDCYKSAIDVLEKNSDIMFVILDTVFIDENVNLVGAGVYVEINNKLVFYRDESRFDAVHSGKIPLTCIAMVFRKEVAQIYLNMDDRFDIGSDIRFIFHAAARYNFATLSKVGSFVTIHSDSFSVIKNNFNLVHEGVQISRYIEIYHDEKVSSYIRNRAMFYLKGLLTCNTYKPMVIGAIKRLIYNLCNPTNLSNEIVELDIKSSRDAGYIKTSAILKFFYSQFIVKKVISLMLGMYFENRRVKNKRYFSELQSDIYRKEFESVKDINSVVIEKGKE